MSATDDAFVLLTEQNTFVVLDTETCPAADGGPPRIVSVAAVKVVGGKMGRPTSRLVDPGQPITNAHIHHITDAMVSSVKVKTFASVSKLVDRWLAAPDVVLVAHNAPYDIAALRGEYERLGQDIENVPVLDTMTLPKAVQHDTGNSRSLRAVAESLGITHTTNHIAAEDAKTCARILLALLRMRAAQGGVDLDLLVGDAGGKDTRTTRKPRRRTQSPREDAPALPEAHLATHSVVLPTDPSDADIDEWVANAITCAELRCPLAQERAKAAQEQARPLLPRLLAALPGLADPGQPATLALMVSELVVGLQADEVKDWWTKNKPLIGAAPRCVDGQSCPTCREGTACALDTLHQPLARVACAAPDGVVSTRTINQLTGTGGYKRLNTWVRAGLSDLAGYAAWLCADTLEADNNRSRASSVIDHACALDLDRVEPRIALARAKMLAHQSRFAEADGECLACQRGASTDSGFADLSDWRAGALPKLAAMSATPAPRQRTKLRQSRPPSRRQPNRFKY